MKIRVLIASIDNAMALQCAAGETVALDMETQYLCGAVAAEIGGEIRTRGAMAAAEAQAIAMRTNALRYQLKGLTVSDQSRSFQAFSAARMTDTAYALCHEAVQRTQGIVLYYDGKLIDAPSFSRNNGGRTTSALERWPGGGGRPWLIEQDDPWDAATGKPKKGHGVGMSQLGAVYAAEELGKSVRDILAFYYPGTELRSEYGAGSVIDQTESVSGEAESVAETENAYNRALIPFTNEHFIAFCEKMVGQPYWYGTCLYRCVESLRKSKANQYPSHYTASRTAQYTEDIKAKKVAADCIGGAKGYAWTGGGIGVLESIGTGSAYSSRYGSNGCPDHGANGMFTYAKGKGADWGTIDTLPELPGIALWKDGHVGYYAGGGNLIEWKGFSSGCVRSRLADRPFTHWYKLPFIQYGESSGLASEYSEWALMPTLARGSNGHDVMVLQVLLLEMGYDLGTYGTAGNGVDGDFGKKTEAAVKAFQVDHGLFADGIVGQTTWKAILPDDDGSDEDSVQEAKDGVTEAESDYGSADSSQGVQEAQEAAAATLFTVTVPGLTAYKANELVAKYPGTTVVQQD